MNKVEITSEQNQKIKRIKELLKQKKARLKQQCFVIEGIRAIKEIPKTQSIITLVVSQTVEAKLYETLQVEECLIVSEALFQSLSETKHAQGMLAVIRTIDRALDELVIEKGTYLILENLQDPGNLGTIIRTAHAFKFKGILMTKGCVDLYSPKVVRSTMSSLFYVPIVLGEEMKTYITFLKNKGVRLCTTALTQDTKPLNKMIFQKPMALIIGNEGNGVSTDALEASDEKIKIPMPGGAESLNASVAAGICMYEIMKGEKDEYN